MRPTRDQILHNLPRRWYIPVTISIRDLADNLSEEDWEKYNQSIPEVNIVLHFDYSAPDPSVGIFEPDLSWDGDWSLPRVGNYPDKIKDAITAYLGSIDVDAKWGEDAYDTLADYVDSRLEPPDYD